MSDHEIDDDKIDQTQTKTSKTHAKDARKPRDEGSKARMIGLGAGAAIGSAALTAALLYASRRRDKADKPTSPPPHPEQARETD